MAAVRSKGAPDTGKSRFTPSTFTSFCESCSSGETDSQSALDDPEVVRILPTCRSYCLDALSVYPTSRDTSAAPSRMKRERGTTRSKPASCAS